MESKYERKFNFKFGSYFSNYISDCVVGLNKKQNNLQYRMNVGGQKNCIDVV